MYTFLPQRYHGRTVGCSGASIVNRQIVCYDAQLAVKEIMDACELILGLEKVEENVVESTRPG